MPSNVSCPQYVFNPYVMVTVEQGRGETWGQSTWQRVRGAAWNGVVFLPAERTCLSKETLAASPALALGWQREAWMRPSTPPSTLETPC